MQTAYAWCSISSAPAIPWIWVLPPRCRRAFRSVPLHKTQARFPLSPSSCRLLCLRPFSLRCSRHQLPACCLPSPSPVSRPWHRSLRCLIQIGLVTSLSLYTSLFLASCQCIFFFSNLYVFVCASSSHRTDFRDRSSFRSTSFLLTSLTLSKFAFPPTRTHCCLPSSRLSLLISFFFRYKWLCPSHFSPFYAHLLRTRCLLNTFHTNTHYIWAFDG